MLHPRMKEEKDGLILKLPRLYLRLNSNWCFFCTCGIIFRSICLHFPGCLLCDHKSDQVIYSEMWSLIGNWKKSLYHLHYYPAEFWFASCFNSTRTFPGLALPLDTVGQLSSNLGWSYFCQMSCHTSKVVCHDLWWRILIVLQCGRKNLAPVQVASGWGMEVSLVPICSCLRQQNILG